MQKRLDNLYHYLCGPGQQKDTAFWKILQASANATPQDILVVVPDSENKAHVLTLLSADIQVDTLSDLLLGADYYRHNWTAVTTFLNQIPSKDQTFNGVHHTKGFVTCFYQLIKSIDEKGWTKEGLITSYSERFKFKAEAILAWVSDFHYFRQQYEIAHENAALNDLFVEKSVYIYGVFEWGRLSKKRIVEALSVAKTSAVLSLYTGEPIWWSDISAHDIPLPISSQIADAPTCHTYADIQQECLGLVQALKASPEQSAAIMVEPGSDYSRLIPQLCDRYDLGLSNKLTSPWLKTSQGHFVLALLNWMKTPEELDAILGFFSTPCVSMRLDILSNVAEFLNVDFSLSAWRFAWKRMERVTEVLREKEELESGYYDQYIQVIEEQGRLFISVYQAVTQAAKSKNMAEWMKQFGMIVSLFEKTKEADLSPVWSFCKGVSGSLDLHYFSDVLTGYLSNIPVQGPEQQAKAHLIAKTPLIFSSYDRLYIPGFSDKQWPKWSQENPLIPTAAQAKFSWIVPEKQKDILILTCQKAIYLSTFETPSSLISCHVQSAHIEDTYLQSPLKAPEPQAGNTIFSSQEMLGRYQTFLKNYTFSASQLDQYQHCPKSYFYHRLLHAKPINFEQGQVSALLWGTMVHDILYRFYHNLKKPERSLESLKSLAKKVLETYQSQHMLWDIKSEALFGYSDKPGILKRFFDEQQDWPLEVYEVEKEFQVEVQVDDDPVIIKGKIDVVYQDPQTGHLSVADYKTGATIPGPTDIKTFKALQIPLYMSALKNTDTHLDAGIYYRVRDDHQFGQTVVCCTKVAKESVFDLKRKRPFIYEDTYFDQLKQHTQTLIKHIKSGDFTEHHYDDLDHMRSKRPQTCRNCDFRRACKYEKRYEAAYGF